MADEIFLRSYHVSRLDMQSDQLNRILAYWGFWMCWSGGTFTFFHWNQRKVWRKFFFSQIHLNSNISSFRSNYQQLFNENFLTWSVDLLPYMVLVFYFFFSLRIEKFNQVNCCLKLTFFSVHFVTCTHKFALRFQFVDRTVSPTESIGFMKLTSFTSALAMCL